MESSLDLWQRAKEALIVSRHDLPVSPDAAASRAYYAAFYGVSAFFALDGKLYTKHSAVEAAVHRDLVRPRTLGEELGRGYSRLAQLRARGDYGGARHVSGAEAEEAVDIATRLPDAVVRLRPDHFDGDFLR